MEVLSLEQGGARHRPGAPLKEVVTCSCSSCRFAPRVHATGAMKEIDPRARHVCLETTIHPITVHYLIMHDDKMTKELDSKPTFDI